MDKKHQKRIAKGLIIFFAMVFYSYLNIGTESWPFSPFGMYSQASVKDYYTVEIFDEKNMESTLKMGPYRFFYNSHMKRILRRNTRKDGLDREIKEEILQFSKKMLSESAGAEYLKFVKVSYWSHFNYKNRYMPDYSIVIQIQLEK